MADPNVCEHCERELATSDTYGYEMCARNRRTADRILCDERTIARLRAALARARESARTGWSSARSLAVAFGARATEKAADAALEALKKDPP